MTSATSDRVLFSPSHVRYINFSTSLPPSPREPERGAHGALEFAVTERPSQLQHHGRIVTDLDPQRRGRILQGISHRPPHQLGPRPALGPGQRGRGAAPLGVQWAVDRLERCSRAQ